MANIKSSQKAARQRITRTARNVARKTAMRTAVKKVRAAPVCPCHFQCGFYRFRTGVAEEHAV